jgi:hypothetical protein
VSVRDCEKRENQKKALESNQLEVVQKAFKEAFDKSILNPSTTSIGSVREELLKQGYEIISLKDKEKEENALYCSEVIGNLVTNHPNLGYRVTYQEYRNRKEEPWKSKKIIFLGVFPKKETVALSEMDAIHRLTPLPFGVRMGDSRETVQKKLGLTDKMLLEYGNIISRDMIFIKSKNASYHLAFLKNKRLCAYAVEFTN